MDEVADVGDVDADLVAFAVGTTFQFDGMQRVVDVARFGEVHRADGLTTSPSRKSRRRASSSSWRPSVVRQRRPPA